MTMTEDSIHLRCHSIGQTLIDLRLKEMEIRSQVTRLLREVDDRKLWKAFGYRSMNDYCDRNLCYSEGEGRLVLRSAGILVTAKELTSPDPEVQKRIEALRKWRREKASSQGVSAYRILTNRTLLRLAEIAPQTRDDIRTVGGIGSLKAGRYGDEIVALIKRAD